MNEVFRCRLISFNALESVFIRSWKTLNGHFFFKSSTAWQNVAKAELATALHVSFSKQCIRSPVPRSADIQHRRQLSLSLSLSTSLIPSHSHTSERTPNTDNQFYFEVLSQLKRHEAEQLRTFRRKTSTTSDPVIPSTTKQNVVQRGKRIYR